MEEKLTLMQSIKVIFVTLVAFMIPIGLTSFILNKVFELKFYYGAGIGLILTIALIFIFGLHKPVYENQNKDYNDDEDED